ncbi:unnamed protein product [Brassica oleracea]
MAIPTSTSMNEDEPPFKKRRLTFIRRQVTILMLPDDLILNCLTASQDWTTQLFP